MLQKCINFTNFLQKLEFLPQKFLTAAKKKRSEREKLYNFSVIELSYSEGTTLSSISYFDLWMGGVTGGVALKSGMALGVCADCTAIVFPFEGAHPILRVEINIIIIFGYMTSGVVQYFIRILL